jgi:2-phosphosulfolactate phosphatase
MFYDQTDYAIRFEWGARGVDVLAACSEVVIIVDVLSFSTCVDIATARGAVILPYQWRDASADTYARENHALLASKTRRFAGEHSLAPTSLLTIKAGTRLVLPSPNGSTLTMRAAASAVTLTGCLRNAHAVATLAQTLGHTIAVIACGEQWEDGSLRPAFEDMLGAGAIIKGLAADCSPEALAAVAVFEQCHADLPGILKRCASGKELIERGFEADVVLAGQLDVSQSTPLLQAACYIDYWRASSLPALQQTPASGTGQSSCQGLAGEE